MSFLSRALRSSSSYILHECTKRRPRGENFLAMSLDSKVLVSKAIEHLHSKSISIIKQIGHRLIAMDEKFTLSRLKLHVWPFIDAQYVFLSNLMDVNNFYLHPRTPQRKDTQTPKDI